MSGDFAARHALARHPDEETRYRAVAELDAARPDDLEVLVERLDDASWRVRTAAVERLAAADDPAAALPRLLAMLSGGPSIGARDASAAALARVGRPAVAALVERLDAPEADLRQASAAVLGQIADRRTVPALAARLADPDPAVRGACADALGRIGGGEAVGALVAALDSDDATLRLAALEALAALGFAPPASRLAAFLADPAARRPAYRLLGASDDPAALDLVAGGLAPPGRGAREAALGAIGRQRDRQAAEELAPVARAARAVAARDPSLADACARALSSEEPFVAAGALTVLGWIGASRHAFDIARAAADERLRPLVEDALEALPADAALVEAVTRAASELSPAARLPGLTVLARSGNDAALRILVDRACDPDKQLRAEAIASLGRLGDVRAVAPLAGLLADGEPVGSGLAAAALCRLATRSVETRQAVLAEVRRRAGAAPSSALYRVVGAVAEEEDLPIVRDGLRSPSAGHRGEAVGAVAALARRGRLAAGPAELVAALTDPAWSVRSIAAQVVAEIAAASAEGRLGDRAAAAATACAAALPALAVAQRDPEPNVRARAIEALAGCGRSEHATEWTALAADRETPAVVAVAALHALAATGRAGPDAIARAAAHPDPEVVKEAVALAARVPGPAGAEILARAAASDRWDVRRAAARAMAARRDPALRDDAARRAASDPDPLVARAFAEAVAALEGR